MTDAVPETAGEHPDLLYAEQEPHPSGSDGDPDVLLNVPTLKVERVSLDVEDLRARVSLEADVLDLLRLHVGVDVVLGKVNLEIDGVDAQALLKVRLDNVAEIVSDVLRTIDGNPEIITRSVGQVAESVRDVSRQVPETARQVGDLASNSQLPETLRSVTDTASSTLGSAPPEQNQEPEPEPEPEPESDEAEGEGKTVDLRAALRDLGKAVGRVGAHQLMELSKRVRR